MILRKRGVIRPNDIKEPESYGTVWLKSLSGPQVKPKSQHALREQLRNYRAGNPQEAPKGGEQNMAIG